MAKPILRTFKQAQKYLADKGVTMSTQQVRNLARTHEVIKPAVSEYTDPVTEETHKVIDQSALDKYLTWRVENPDAGRGGRKASGEKRVFLSIAPDRLDALNQLLTSNGFPAASVPVRTPRKAKSVDGVAQESTNGSAPAPLAIENLELIEVE